jgi:hypothetical protein
LTVIVYAHLRELLGELNIAVTVKEFVT